MGITTIGKSVIASNMTGSALSTHIGVGLGSTTFVSGNIILEDEFEGTGVNRNLIDTTDTTTAGQVTMIANWSPLDISGCILAEFGVFTTGSALLSRQVLTGSLTFDGEQELQIQNTTMIKLD